METERCEPCYERADKHIGEAAGCDSVAAQIIAGGAMSWLLVDANDEYAWKLQRPMLPAWQRKKHTREKCGKRSGHASPGACVSTRGLSNDGCHPP
ncbi:hypothetical protein [Lysobacter sp. CA196]|uniref:hypothetical protein n=1 Tax=Lysobacter sp. CA196 TaxID=3455606 RepID=UPI003F8D2805